MKSRDTRFSAARDPVCDAAADHPEIQEVDINPIIVHEQGASVVDARIIIM
jgi:hypothetical protein